MTQVCLNNNNGAGQFKWDSCSTSEPSSSNRPKRDFRIKVIEVSQEHPKYFVWPSRNRGSTEDVDENRNSKAKETETQPTTFSANQFVTYGATQNGYGAMRRNVQRGSKKKSGDGNELSARTSSEPAPRRISLKKDKAVTEPINAPSTTFKILSINKKWDSFDGEEETEVVPCTLCSGEMDRRRTTTN